MYVCMYVCIYVCIYVCMYVCMYVHVQACHFGSVLTICIPGVCDVLRICMCVCVR